MRHRGRHRSREGARGAELRKTTPISYSRRVLVRHAVPGGTGSKRRRADYLPAVPAAHLVGLGVVDRALRALQSFLEEPTCLGRGVEEENTAGLGARVLPSMRHASRHEGTGAGSADRDLVADLESDLAAQHPGDLVAVAVQMERCLSPGGRGLLE